uniref:OSJNBa0070D17.22 protein n=1 Tax=Oryza sativa subsp. japonica TaxID=39947 RepID=Q7X8M2_ORYSJ|nr:OSJNBb0016B03.8 [Oryza sativa Japonica Group]CAE04971.2 OSJNBa0070D17.22 [Oryza sativa Japonica Group]
MTGTAAEAEESGGAGRDDDDDDAPTVGGRSGAADGVDGDAAMPREVAPSREEGRSDDGGEPERRKATARFGMPRATVLRQSADEAERRTGSAATRRSGWRCRRVERESGAATAAERSSTAMAERAEHGASTNPTARASDERRKRKSGARGGFK